MSMPPSPSVPHTIEPPALDAATATFLDHRNLLFTVAYEMLGSATDAEDVLQETWLRWSTVDHAIVESPRAYLIRITTRQALQRLRTLGRRKESYIGEWLPEPLLTTPDVAEDAELAESVSMAMLLVLETLNPTERAVFVLREVFDLSYDEIAAAVDKNAAAVRQIAHRARAHVHARRPRVDVSPTQARSVLEAFHRAITTGHLQALFDLLSPDVVLIPDGGGLVRAALGPVVGADQVMDLFSRIPRPTTSRLAEINGYPAVIVGEPGHAISVIAVRIDRGRITGLYAVRNPEKLMHLDHERSLQR